MMRLIGMLDSPYVRRVAISLKMLDLPFSHESVSVFSTFVAFAEINPVVKAPTLVTEQGVVLMDSNLILEYAARIAAPELGLSPAKIEHFTHAQRIIGLALAACEKSIQIVYEHSLRPSEKRHQPWLDRVHGQLAEALRLLEAEIDQESSWIFGDRPLQADITSAVAFRFTSEMLPDVIAAGDYRALAALSQRAEATEAFLAFPFS
ncbi:MAG: glutathione S-transferase [Phyllobacterium sp.]|uniref:glutathione S-transferase n=1 Tax=Phyllobacterium sp. TaxID=1871046 RepID=UPI0030F09D61